MVIIKKPLSIEEIKKKHNQFFKTMVKLVVDVEKEIVALDAELHADLEEQLLKNNSNQKNLWGANIYFSKPKFIEFTALINIRPSQGNKSMEVQDKKIRKKMQKIVDKLIIW